MNGDRTPRDMTARPPTRCLSCDDPDRALYGRGLCRRCFQRAYSQGIQRAWPACGRRPVPYRALPAPPTPAIPPAMAVSRARAVAREGAPAAAYFAALDRFWGRAGRIAP